MSSVNACPFHLPGEFLGDMADPHSRLHGGEAGSLLTSGACGQMLLEHGQLQRCHGVPGWPQVRKYGNLDRFLCLLRYLWINSLGSQPHLPRYLIGSYHEGEMHYILPTAKPWSLGEGGIERSGKVGRGKKRVEGTGIEETKSTTWLAAIVSTLTGIDVDDSHIPSQFLPSDSLSAFLLLVPGPLTAWWPSVPTFSSLSWIPERTAWRSKCLFLAHGFKVFHTCLLGYWWLGRTWWCGEHAVERLLSLIGNTLEIREKGEGSRARYYHQGPALSNLLLARPPPSKISETIQNNAPIRRQESPQMFKLESVRNILYLNIISVKV